MIRVLIVDDHALVRAGLAQLLESAEDISVVALAADGEEALGMAREHDPDVVLMDLSMPGMDGAEVTRRLLDTGTSAKVVVLTSLSARERILGALDAGAIGYLLKDADPDELLRGIRSAARGDSPLAPPVARELLAARDAVRPKVELSPREVDVLRLVGEGLPNKLIARRLEISEKTVKAHLTRAFSQLGVADRTQAALWIERNGLPGPSR
jgi:DNA-binding NarL/FixJ family response regulator